MSFRLRVLALLMLVAMAATAATAWLTLRQANRQVRETVTAGRQEVSRITGELRAYGFAHGTWDGLSPTVARLAKDTGQRVRVATDSGVLIADSDALVGRDPRAPSSQPPVLVDPRPVLRLPEGQVPRLSLKQAALAIADYRAAVAYAACLTRAGAEPTARPDERGVPGSARTADPRGARSPTGQRIRAFSRISTHCGYASPSRGSPPVCSGCSTSGSVPSPPRVCRSASVSGTRCHPPWPPRPPWPSRWGSPSRSSSAPCS